MVDGEEDKRGAVAVEVLAGAMNERWQLDRSKKSNKNNFCGSHSGEMSQCCPKHTLTEP